MVMMFIFGAAMIAAAFCDLTTYRIPNWISLFLIVGFLAIAPFANLTWSEFGLHVLVGVCSLFVMMSMFAFGWLGGGDAKLYAATALWWLPQDLLLYTLLTTVIGGLLALLLILSRKFLPANVKTKGWVHNLLRKEEKMPYGLALAAAGLYILPQSSIFASAAGL